MITGMVPFSTVDFPGHLAAVFFLQGCPWRCVYCHNPHLQSFSNDESELDASVMEFLESRKSFLTGIVLSGGEPLAHKNVEILIKKIRSIGYKIGVHTSGSYPNRLKSVICDIDWIGLDIKAPFDLYKSITGIERSGCLAEESLEIILKSGISFEVRTTAHQEFLPEEELLRMASHLSEKGVKTFVLQKARINSTCVTYSKSLFDKLQSQFENFLVRED